jgi:hypothetical protein
VTLVRAVYLVLLANGLPAFVLLSAAPDSTDSLFVWTVQPPASAHLLAAMYGNALVLVALGFRQPDWARQRVTLAVIAPFSLLATAVTLATLDPFLKHAWYHLAYWLTMYLLLCVLAPVTFVVNERRAGGRLPVSVRLGSARRGLLSVTAIGLLVTAVLLLVDTSAVSKAWPWALTPLVGRLIGVWMMSLALGYAWVLWDGDAVRGRPLLLAGAPTALLLVLAAALHPGDVDRPLWLFAALVALFAASGGAGLASGGAHRAIELRRVRPPA